MEDLKKYVLVDSSKLKKKFRGRKTKIFIIYFR